MKKILLLTSLFLISFISSCFAVDLNDSRWFRIYDVGADKKYIDMDTIEFASDCKNIFNCNKKHRYISGWEYTELPNDDGYKYTLAFVHWDLDCKKIKYEEITAFKNDGTVHGKEDNHFSKPIRSQPGSILEYELQIMDRIWKEYNINNRK